jgi:mono/diheme cytochrome c family protein
VGESARTPGAPAWPAKLITQGEAFAKAASWPVYAMPAPQAGINLHCGQCHRSAGQLRRGGVPYNGSLDEMLAMVLRHMVMAHDVPLNTRAPAADDPGRIPGPGVTPEQYEQSWRGRHPLDPAEIERQTVRAELGAKAAENG